MTFKLYKNKRNAYDVIRRLGYIPIGTTPEGEMNCVRPLGGDYPRFHIYLKEDAEIFHFTLHLDQKKPVYKGTAAHSGEYDSDVVKDEASRIRGILLED